MVGNLTNFPVEGGDAAIFLAPVLQEINPLIDVPHAFRRGTDSKDTAVLLYGFHLLISNLSLRKPHNLPL
jgi:hypothetical protein